MVTITSVFHEQLARTGTEMGRLIARHEWSTTPLGPIEGWPQPLKTLVGVMLGSAQAMFIAWGPDRTLLYNDAYTDALQEKHPQALGCDILDVWAEIRADLLPIVGKAYAGESVHMDDIMLVMHRRGYPEETHFAFSYTPVRTEDGRVAGFFCPCNEITGQVLAGRQLRESEERLRLVFEGASDYAILTMDDERRVTSWSPGAESAFGYAADEIVGRPADILFTPEDRSVGQPEKEVGIARSTGLAPDVRWHQRKDGSVVFLDGTARPLHDAGGRHIGYLKIARDETERRRREEVLHETEERYRLAAHATNDAIWDWRMADGQVIWNDALGTLFGHAERETSAEWWIEHIHPEDRDRISHSIHAVIDGGGVNWTEEYRFRTADGGHAHVLDRGTVLRDEGGQAIRMIGAMLDLTERRRMEERLRELNENLEAQVAERTAERDRVWRNSRDLLGVADADGRWISVNPAWNRVLGWTDEEIVGRTSEWLEHPDDQERTRAEIAHLAAGGQTLAFENRFRAKGGDYRDLSWTAVPEAGLLYCAGRDVTQDKAREAELAEAQEQLRQAQKMEAVGQLTGGIAHDFNNLLTGVIGSLDLMQRRIARGETDRVERYATAAMTSANRAAALTHRLLAFSRRQPLDPKPVNANRLVTGMEELLRRTIGEAVRLEIVTAGGLWQTLCDPHQLESAILNLAINARDAMPEGGSLTIETCNARLDSAYAAKQREVTPGQYVCICVTDTGAGMTKETIEKAFEPFFTTKPIGQGTGLGLSMIYGFARQSEGYAKIYSEVGEGTTVKLYLPRYYGEAEQDEDGHGELTDAHRAEHGEVVLVVEDETAVRDLVVDVLQELGYRPVEASDGPSGLKLLQSDMRIDLLVTDVGLPGLNGRQLADAARRQRPDLRILFMTGYAENAMLANGFLEPGMEMITKPFAIEALANRIRDMIEERA